MTVPHVELAYLGRSGLEIAPSSDDLRGLVVVGPDGLRIGEVDDVVVDTQDHRLRLVQVAAGDILGFAAKRWLVPVETIVKVDDRVHLDRSHAEVHAHAPADGSPDRGFVEVYEAFGVAPFGTPATPVD